VLEEKLNACHQWCLRRLLRISHLQRVTNTEASRRTNQTQFSTVLCDRCLRLFRHVARSDARMDHSKALRAVTSGLPSHWRRPPGRPRQSWTWTIEKDLSALSIGLHTAWKIVNNGNEPWKRLCSNMGPALDNDDDDDDDDLWFCEVANGHFHCCRFGGCSDCSVTESCQPACWLYRFTAASWQVNFYYLLNSRVTLEYSIRYSKEYSM